MGRLSRLVRKVAPIAKMFLPAIPVVGPLLATVATLKQSPIVQAVQAAKLFKSRGGGIVSPIGIATRLADDPLGVEEEIFNDEEDFDDEDFDDEDYDDDEEDDR